MIPPGSLIRTQQWKLYVGFAGLGISGLAMFFDASVAALFSVSRYMPTLVGTFVGLLSFAWLSLVIRCSNCGLRFFWHAVSSKTAGGWLAWLVAAEKCPRCGQ